MQAIKDPNKALSIFLKDIKASGMFTLKSSKTGKEFTYNIQRFKSKKYENYLTKVSIETGYMNFRVIGYYYNGLITIGGNQNASIGAQAVQYVLRKVEQNLPITDVTVFHTGNCLKCGKILTDSQSIERGLGQKCASY